MNVPPPPPTPAEDVVEELHGEPVADPYRWLEDPSSPRTKAWTETQNRRTRTVLDALPDRAALARRLREHLSTGLLETPRLVGTRVFHTRREGGQPQSVLYVRERPEADDRALIDPNRLDAGGLATLDWWYASHDGRFVAYGLSRGGDEMSSLHVLDLATGAEVGDPIPHTQRASVAWTDDGFYYTVHPQPGTVPPGDEHYHRRIRFHRLGSHHGEDALVFGEGRPKEDMLHVETSPDGRWVVLSAYHGWVRNDVYLLDRRSGRVATVVEGRDGLVAATPADDALWIRTNLEAPRYRICRAELADPSAERWTTVVPEGEHAIEGFAVTRGHLAVHTLEHATSRLAVWTQEGRRARDVALPGPGALTTPSHQAGVEADPRGELVAYTYQSFATPPAAFVADAETGEARCLVRLRAAAGSDPGAIAVDQVSYRSKDGTAVSMFVVHRRDVRPTGDVPTVLTGYGGFNIARTPAFAAAATTWAELGGVYALANLRGGSEYGERWHREGMLGSKQNVFDDFHAAAEHLVASGWTSAGRLGIVGGSNGGLLVGAALTQRPELFAAVVCNVPLLDMLRYQRLLIARLWIAEYGSSEDPEQFRWLRAYSPYHNVRAGLRYPPLLLTTAEGDSRVDPMHARKMAALLQSERIDAPCVLLRVDRDAGHGVGKPLDKQVDDAADQWAFLASRLGLALPAAQAVK
ncbi:MAG TPA: prolyl oligopeptidase family serine peptidase [Candidatus Limnocylindrales bacterium]|nr:prolyl oligopeptidase family serine peptidase [Candidatus Limnocylindrales bacterium]